MLTSTMLRVVYQRATYSDFFQKNGGTVLWYEWVYIMEHIDIL